MYDDLLRAGKRIFCIAADDNHNRYPDGDPLCDSCGGFTMIKAPCLAYEAITDALVKGRFYASQGPEIHALRVEDGKVFVKTSDAVAINYSTGMQRCQCVRATADHPCREASFTIREEERYFRLTVIDRSGRCAYTNAYFVDTL